VPLVSLTRVATICLVMLTLMLVLSPTYAQTSHTPILQICYGVWCTILRGGEITLKIISKSLIKVKISNTLNESAYYTIYLNHKLLSYGYLKSGAAVTQYISIDSSGNYNITITLGNYTYRIAVISYKDPVKLIQKIYYVPFKEQSTIVIRLAQRIPLVQVYVNDSNCTFIASSNVWLCKLNIENITLPRNSTIIVKSIDYGHEIHISKLSILIIPIVRIAKVNIEVTKNTTTSSKLNVCISLQSCSPAGIVNLTLLIDNKVVKTLSMKCGSRICLNLRVLLMPGVHVLQLLSNNYILLGKTFKIIRVKKQYLNCSISLLGETIAYKELTVITRFPLLLSGRVKVRIFHGSKIINSTLLYINNSSEALFHILPRFSGNYKISIYAETKTAIISCSYQFYVKPLCCSISIYNRTTLTMFPLRRTHIAGKLLIGTNLPKLPCNVSLFINKSLVKVFSVNSGKIFKISMFFNRSGTYNVTICHMDNGVVSTCCAHVIIKVLKYYTYLVATINDTVVVAGTSVCIGYRLKSRVGRFSGHIVVRTKACGREQVQVFDVGDGSGKVCIPASCVGVMTIQVQYSGDTIHSCSNVVNIRLMVVPGIAGIPITHVLLMVVTLLLGYYVSNIVVQRRRA